MQMEKVQNLILHIRLKTKIKIQELDGVSTVKFVSKQAALDQMKEKFGDERLTKIAAAEGEFNEEDLIKKGIDKLKDLFIQLKMPSTLSELGFVKDDIEYMANRLTKNGTFVFKSNIPLDKELAIEIYKYCL